MSDQVSATHHDASCFRSTLRAVMHGRCMVRNNYTDLNITMAPEQPQLPVYITHAPFLTARHAYMEAQLRALRTEDVTWVECFNRDDVEQLSVEAHGCLYPCSTFDIKPGVKFMANGTFSLAVKHRLAAFDIAHRGISAALVLEDDAALPLELWSQLGRVRLPSDAGLFYLGSFSSRSNVGTLSYQNGGGCHTRVTVGQPLIPQGHVGTWMSVWRRNFTCFPTILGNVAYVMLGRGAHMHSRGPITSPADVGLSLWPEQRHGNPITCEGPASTLVNHANSVPTVAYAPDKWIAWPGNTGPPATAIPKDMQSRFTKKVLEGGTHYTPG